MHLRGGRRTIHGVLRDKGGNSSKPKKISELKETPSPNTLRDAQGLNVKLTTLNRFISKSAEKAIPLFYTLKGCIEKSNFQWTPEAELALQKIKKGDARAPYSSKPNTR